MTDCGYCSETHVLTAGYFICTLRAYVYRIDTNKDTRTMLIYKIIPTK